MVYDNINQLAFIGRSVRTFDQTRKIGRETLEYLVDTARVSPSAANRQPLKYKIVNEESEVASLLPLTKWAGFFKDIKLPPEGHGPVAFIMICHDKSVCEAGLYSTVDVGIAAEAINLASRERDIASCMIGAFDKDAAAELFMLPRTCDPVLLIALGYPEEFPIICSVGEDGDTKYFRDDAGLHFVPKRKLEDILL